MDAAIEAVQEGRVWRLKLSGELCIYSAAQLKEELLGYLHSSQELEINLANVEEIDTAGFQLLLLLKREAVAAAKPMRLVSHSQATLEVLEMLNMEAYFGDPVVLAS